MSKFFSKDVFPIRWRFVFFLSVLSLGGIFYVYNSNTPETWIELFTAVSTGLLCHLISLLCEWQQYKTLDKFRVMGVLDVLNNRRDKAFYENELSKAKEIVQVMGTSCERFVDDFANEENDAHVLIDALKKNEGLKVFILLPKIEKMDDKSRSKFDTNKPKFEKLKKKFSNQVEIKHYAFEAHCSLVRVDDILIVGPVFRGTESKDSPAIHIKANSPYAIKHIEYFEEVLKEEGTEDMVLSDNQV